MTLRMMRSRGRKMMMLRMLMLWRRNMMMLRDVEEDDAKEEDKSQDRDRHFVQGCPIEMHMDM